MLEITDPENGAVEHIDGFVIPEVGDIDDWKKADEFFTIIEHEHGLEEGSLSMSVIVESGEAELAMGDLREEMGKPSNNLERMFLLVDGEVDYTKDMRAMTPTGELPPWPELRHNTSRGASAAGLIAVDGPYDDIRDVEGYRERMKDNRAKGMTGIWSLTPGQVVEANTAPLPPKTGSWLLDVGGQEVELNAQDGKQVYDGDDLSLETDGEGGYVLQAGGNRLELDEDELTEELLDRTAYIPSMTDIVDSMEEFEAAKEAGKGAIAMTQPRRWSSTASKSRSVKTGCGTKRPTRPPRHPSRCSRTCTSTARTSTRNWRRCTALTSSNAPRLSATNGRPQYFVTRNAAGVVQSSSGSMSSTWWPSGSATKAVYAPASGCGPGSLTTP